MFEVYVETQLAPLLEPGDVVVLDNLPAHKGEKAKGALKERGAWFLFLPPYSPRSQPHRNGVRQVEGPFSPDRRQDHRRPLESRRRHLQPVETRRVSQLLRRCRLCARLNAQCSGVCGPYDVGGFAAHRSRYLPPELRLLFK
ncbi:transposase [Sphingomonas sp.]|uniref:transposase n=1 Tax=Sphingomonas sp. TaxID=28214 RepID=UPI0035AE21F0